MRPEDVVALPSLDLDHGHVERVEEFPDDRELRLQVDGGRRTVDLVLLERVAAELRLAAVERHDHGVGPELLDELDEHRDEAERRVRRSAVRCGHRRRQRVKRAMDEAVAVDDRDGADRVFHGSPSVTASERAHQRQRACVRGHACLPDSTRGGRLDGDPVQVRESYVRTTLSYAFQR